MECQSRSTHNAQNQRVVGAPVSINASETFRHRLILYSHPLRLSTRSRQQQA
jgi:hypothetical protein